MSFTNFNTAGLKHFILFCSLFFVFCLNAEAQVKQLYIGKTGSSELGISSAELKNGNRVIVGSRSLGSDTFDAVITCIDTAGNTVWAKEISTPNNDRFISVVATSDGGCVAVGYVNQQIRNPYSNNQAAIYKFDASGAILWNKILKATSYGECLFSVLEVPGSGNIVCGGINNFGAGNNNAGFIVNLNSSGTINWAKRYYATLGNEVHGITYLSGKIIATGFYRGLSFYDGNLFAVAENNGSVIWNRSFDYTSNFFAACNTVFGESVKVVGSKIYVDGFVATAWGAVPGSRAASLVAFDTTGMNPQGIEYKINGFNYNNAAHSTIVSDNEIYLFQMGSHTYWEWLHCNIPMSGIQDVYCSKIKDITNPFGSLAFCKKFSTTGVQFIVASDIKNGIITGIGSAKDDPASLSGQQDFFKVEFDTSIPASVLNCVSIASDQQLGTLPISFNPSFSFASITNLTFTTPIVPTVTPITYNSNKPCIVIPKLKADFEGISIGCFDYKFNDLTISDAGIQYWKWYFGDGDSSSLQNPTHVFSASGTYMVKLVVTDSLGNKDSVSKPFIIEYIRFAKAGNDTILCTNAGIASIHLNASGGVSYLWSPILGLSDANIANPMASINSKSTYVVTVTDANGCIDKDTITIDLKPGEANVIATPKDISGCPGKEVQLNASGTKSYLWQPSTGLDNDKISNPKLTLMGIDTYVVTGTDTNGCADRDTISVTTFPSPRVRATSDNNKVDCVVGSALLSASGALNYEWSPGVFCETPNSATTQARPPATTVFTVKGSDANGCGGIDTITVFYEGKTVVKVPNAFTPNNDGLNDKIKPIIACDFVLSEFTIYNRWGNRVYTTADVNKGWDGNYDGEECELGVYYYFVKGKNSKDEEVLLKGDISLVR